MEISDERDLNNSIDLFIILKILLLDVAIVSAFDVQSGGVLSIKINIECSKSMIRLLRLTNWPSG